MKFKEFDKPEYFVNRELSWIKFDDRVLSEARDKNLPLFERLKFLSITSSNLDEFYMVRVASLKDQVHAGYKKTDIAGMTAKEQLKAISRQTHDLVHVQYSTLNRSLVPALEKTGLHVIFEHEAFSEKQKEFVDQYFEDNDEGQLLGHIVIGAQMVHDLAKEIPDFPEKLENQVIHCILAHHGELEYGSPKKPALAEAVALNLADNTDARMETLTEIFHADKGKKEWLGFNRLFESNLRRTGDI